MYRFLLTPRWLAGTLVAVLAVVVCLVMGSWQLGRFGDRVETHRETERGPRDTAAAVPFTDLMGDGGPDEFVAPEEAGDPVTATGRYDAANQLLVPDRTLDGRRGYYVLTPLRTGQGKAVPVVRGWHPGAAPATAPAPPAGEVTVRGAVQQPEDNDTHGTHTAGGLPEGQVGIIRASALVNLLPYQVYDAWITLDPADRGLKAVPPAAPRGGGLDMKAFQNLGYTGEWFAFAGFVLFMWFRYVRREAEVQRDIALGLAPPRDPAPAPAPTASRSG
ncbi:SURF1 family protein [Streptomyces capparidis]